MRLRCAGRCDLIGQVELRHRAIGGDKELEIRRQRILVQRQRRDFQRRRVRPVGCRIRDRRVKPENRADGAELLDNVRIELCGKVHDIGDRRAVGQWNRDVEQPRTRQGREIVAEARHQTIKIAGADIAEIGKRPEPVERRMPVDARDRIAKRMAGDHDRGAGERREAGDRVGRVEFHGQRKQRIARIVAAVGNRHRQG